LKPHFSADDTRDAFNKRWAEVKFRVYTQRGADSLALTADRAKATPVSIPWHELTIREKAYYMGFSMAEEAEIVSGLEVAQSTLKVAGHRLGMSNQELATLDAFLLLLHFHLAHISDLDTTHLYRSNITTSTDLNFKMPSIGDSVPAITRMCGAGRELQAL